MPISKFISKKCGKDIADHLAAIKPVPSIREETHKFFIIFIGRTTKRGEGKPTELLGKKHTFFYDLEEEEKKEPHGTHEKLIKKKIACYVQCWSILINGKRFLII